MVPCVSAKVPQIISGHAERVQVLRCIVVLRKVLIKMAELTLTTVGWVVSPVVEAVVKAMINKARSYIEGQYRLQKGMKEDLEKVEDRLTQIQAVLTAAQRQGSRGNPHLATWLRQIKDAVYETEDVLDEFDYRWLKAQAERSGGRVSRFFSSSLRCGKQLIGLDHLPTTLKKMLQRLDNEVSTINQLTQVLTLELHTKSQQTETEPSRVTASILPQSEIFGREREKDKILGMLLAPADAPESSNTKHICAIAIVGVGGVGKTTLAQYIFNDRKIVEHFDIRMWICVSDNFNEVRLTREILESASEGKENHGDIKNFDILQKTLQSKLKSKRFLLVLDDVWANEQRGKVWDQEWWEKLLAPLKDAAKGSMILLTTRMDIVATTFDAIQVTLYGLSPDETWSLLQKYAFGNEKPNSYHELEKIGLENIKRLNGSPLAAKLVGDMLKDKVDPRQWSEILQSELSSSTDIMLILKLSYQHLPDHLKPCFLYCSIFPKDWQFKPEKLVYLWIAQGCVPPSMTNKRLMMDMGMSYFNQLLSRSFFQKIKNNSDIYYVMHDLMHDLAQEISKDECFRIDDRQQIEIPETTRHLGVAIDDKDKLKDFFVGLVKMSNLKHLRTLIFFSDVLLDSADLPLDMFKQSRGLRVLDFGGLYLEGYPKALGNLIHLRYLDFGENYFEVLLKSLSRLFHLQVLAASKPLPLSRGMFKLFKFDRFACLAVPRLELEVEKKKGGRMGVLQGMGKEAMLQGELCIKNMENVSTKEEAVEADLGSKQNLDGLELEWGIRERIIDDDVSEEVAEALRPHPNLKRLTMKGFQGIRCPSWLHRGFLESLRLTECRDLQGLPPLDHPTLLKRLVVERCPKLTSFPRFPSSLAEIDIQDTGLISHLRLTPSSSPPERFELSTSGVSSHIALLHKDHLQAIEWLCISNCEEPMPARWLLELVALKTLVIERCREWLTPEEKKNGNGVLPSSLESLEIKHCHLTDMGLSRCLQGGLTSLSKLRINFCTGLTSLPSAQVLQNLTALHELMLYGCKDLTSLGGLHALVSLKRSQVLSCSQVKSLPEEGLPASIEELRLWGCHLALQQQILRKKGPDWDKLAYIPRVFA